MFEKNDGFAVSNIIYKNARELLHLEEALSVLRIERKYDYDVMRAIIPVCAVCTFRTAAKIVRIVVGEPLGNSKRDLVSIIFGDTGETQAPVLEKVSHAVVQAA